MKRIHNWMASVKRDVFTACIFLLLANFVAAQSSTDSTDSSTIPAETSSFFTQEHEAFSPSTESSVNCPHCNLVGEMPMELAEKINAIEDPLEFEHEFVDSNSLENVTTLAHPRDSSRRRRAAKDAIKQATCKPIDTIVSTIPFEERDPTAFYYPSCVTIPQCGGCCAHSGTVCSPVEEVEKTITVKKTKYVGGEKLQAVGETIVNVKIHTKCRCQCKKTASDCTSLQRFVANQCRCECNNIADADKCAQIEGKLWDPKKCACVCRDTRECGLNEEFKQETCSCQPFTDDEFPYFADHRDNETFEATDDTKYETITAAE